MIDNYPIEEGDAVWVTGVGNGTIMGVKSDGSFSVRTGNGVLTCTKGGYIGRSKRIFWFNPAIVVPPKNKDFWKAFRHVAEVVFEEMRLLYNVGQVPEVSDGEVDKKV